MDKAKQMQAYAQAIVNLGAEMGLKAPDMVYAYGLVSQGLVTCDPQYTNYNKDGKKAEMLKVFATGFTAGLDAVLVDAPKDRCQFCGFKVDDPCEVSPPDTCEKATFAAYGDPFKC